MAPSPRILRAAAAGTSSCPTCAPAAPDIAARSTRSLTMTAAGYHYLKTSYDHALRPLGPAAVLRARLIEGLIASGVRRLDFPGEPYEWESQWTDTVRGRVVLTVYPATLRGKLLGLIDRLRHRHDDVGVVHIDPRKQTHHHANQPGARV